MLGQAPEYPNRLEPCKRLFARTITVSFSSFSSCGGIEPVSEFTDKLMEVIGAVSRVQQNAPSDVIIIDIHVQEVPIRWYF
ncbi:hypothetical protein M5689_007586 [Euphorbia peplus]|nr:hypothetical protein M5689_007586 [Euphorbia peplus]